MTDHHDFGDHHDYQGGEDHHYDEPPGYEDQSHFDDPGHYDTGDDPAHFDDPGHLAEEPGHFETADHHETVEDLPAVDDHAADAHSAAADAYQDPADVFPPTVEVGELPEPVDGFPWIDPATLGAPDLAGHDTLPPVDPHELAEYAGTEIPEGADPWTVLAASDDPATSTLARFWHDTGE
jgi:hypothetical protein